VITFIWFLVASIKVLHRNYLHGPTELKKLNTLLLSYFVAKAFFFFTIFGSLYSDMAGFTGLIGLSLALNNGVREPATEPVEAPVLSRLKLITITR